MNIKDVEQLRAYLKSLPRLADSNKDARVKKAKKDFWFFIKTYFPHHIDHSKVETSKFRKFAHKELYNLSKKHNKLLFTAYRGGAKTTVISKLFTLWLLVKGETKHTVIISATDNLVSQIFEFYKLELEDNQNLIHDFNISIPSIWRATELVVSVNKQLSKLVGFGAGKKIRGTAFLSYRPDLIILDDIENDENVESKIQRDKLENWFLKAVLKLPSRITKYRLIVVGTILHHDSLLKRLEKRGDFISFNFPLVIKFPNNPDGKSTVGMVLDDTRIDKKEVLREYKIDKDSFMSEYQNTPLSQDSLVFQNHQTFINMPKCDIYYMGLDPALGKAKGDYFGIALLGYKTETKQFYATVKGYRLSPVHLISRIITTYNKYNAIAPTTIAIEIVQFQEFFKDILKERANEIEIKLAVKELKNTAPKELRINSIAPLINDGTIKVHAKDQLLREELDTYPKAAHDDLLDALEMAYRIFRGGNKINYKEVREKLKRRNFARFKTKYN